MSTTFDLNDLANYSNHNNGVMPAENEALHKAIRHTIYPHWAVSHGPRTDEVVLRGITWNVLEQLDRAGFEIVKKGGHE